jgi:SAM-dependent methyltransferase
MVSVVASRSQGGSTYPSCRITTTDDYAIDVAMDKYHDKKRCIEKISGMDHVILELGCGRTRKFPESISVDLADHDAVDIVGDITTVIEDFPDQSVDLVFSSHAFEHIEDLGRLMKEIARVLKNFGRLEVIVPHFSNPYFYSDPTHRRFFGLYSFSYFAKDEILYRKVPRYSRISGLVLKHVELRFSSPYRWRKRVKRFLGKILANSVYAMELYEECFPYLFPCYEVRYVVQKMAKPG